MDQLKRTKESFYSRVKKIPVRITDQQSKYWINKDLMLHPFLRIFTLTSSEMEFTDESIIFYLNNQGIKKDCKGKFRSGKAEATQAPQHSPAWTAWRSVLVFFSPPLMLLHTHLSTFFSRLPSDIQENTKKTGKSKPSPCSVTTHRNSRSDTCQAKCPALAAQHQKLTSPTYISW